MNFNKPPFEDHVVTIEVPPKLQPNGTIPGVPLAATPMSDPWRNYHALLNDQLSANLSNGGYIFPAVSSATLTTTVDRFGQSMVYNQDLNRLEINNGNRASPSSRAPTSEPIQTYGALSSSQIATEAVKPENLGRIFVNSSTNELQFSIDGATVRTITST